MSFGFMLTIIFLDVSSNLELAFALAKYITCLNIGCKTKSEGHNNFFNIKQTIMSSLTLSYISLWTPYLSMFMHFTTNHHHFWYEAFDLTIGMPYVPFKPYSQPRYWLWIYHPQRERSMSLFIIDVKFGQIYEILVHLMSIIKWITTHIPF
jgi:hypothetical protein